MTSLIVMIKIKNLKFFNLFFKKILFMPNEKISLNVKLENIKFINYINQKRCYNLVNDYFQILNNN